MVESQPSKLLVAGSIPVSRSILNGGDPCTPPGSLGGGDPERPTASLRTERH